MSRLAAAYDRVTVALAILAGVTVVLMFLVILIDVSLRSLGLIVPAFGVTFVEYALVYLTMLAAPWLVRTRVHVCIDILVNRLPPGPRRWVERLIYALAVAASLVFVAVAVALLIDAIGSGRIDVRGIDVPLWVSMIPLPVGFTLVAVEFARFLFGRESYYRGRGEQRESL